MFRVTATLLPGDCRKVLPTLREGSVDAVITDPPAGISFMGKDWDGDRGGRDQWIRWLAKRLKAARRVVRPGGYMLCWALPRTSHWTSLAIEEAGWVIRDRISHLFGTGFPKSQSCLKPAMEDWWLSKAPGGLLPLGIDECRIGVVAGDYEHPGNTGISPEGRHKYNKGWKHANQMLPSPLGRYPANVTHDGSDEVLEVFAAYGQRRSSCGGGTARTEGSSWSGLPYQVGQSTQQYYDAGTAARFFFTAKASKAERGESNKHPTVKPLKLMRWLVKLVCPPEGIVLDPFLGSGTTAVACICERRNCIGIELNSEYLTMAQARVNKRLRNRGFIF